MSMACLSSPHGRKYLMAPVWRQRQYGLVVDDEFRCRWHQEPYPAAGLYAESCQSAGYPANAFGEFSE